MGEFVNSNIKKYYITSVLYGAAFSAPIVILYYRIFGLSYLQISTLESIFLITILLFDIPTGAIADRFGRKMTIVAGAFLLPLGTLLTAMGSSYLVFAIASIIYGISLALFSGAESALVYDSLRESENEIKYIDISGKSYALMFLAMAAVAPIGSYIFSHHFRMPLYIDAAITAFAFLIYLSMSEPTVSKVEKTENYWVSVRSGFIEFMRNPMVRWYAFFAILVSVAFSIFSSTFSQPVIVAHGIEPAKIGFAVMVSALVQAISSYYAQKIEKLFGERYALLIIYIVTGLCLMLFGVMSLLVFIPIYIIYVSVKGFHNPVLGGYIQHNIDSASRATILSVQSFLGSLIGAVALPVFGWLADRLSPTIGSVILGILVLILGSLLFAIRPSRRLAS